MSNIKHVIIDDSDPICGINYLRKFYVADRVKNLPDGEYIEYLNNNVSNEFVVRSGMLNGRVAVYTRKGSPEFTGNFEDNFPDGIFRFYEAGLDNGKFGIISYKKGIKDGEEYYYSPKCTTKCYHKCERIVYKFELHKYKRIIEESQPFDKSCILRNSDRKEIVEYINGIYLMRNIEKNRIIITID